MKKVSVDIFFLGLGGLLIAHNKLLWFAFTCRLQKELFTFGERRFLLHCVENCSLIAIMVFAIFHSRSG